MSNTDHQPILSASPRRFAMSILTLLLLMASPGLGDNITVDTLTNVDSADGQCSLSEALQAAETNAVFLDCPAGNGWDRIDFAVTGTIIVTTNLPAATESLSLVGPGADQLTLDGTATSALFDFGINDGLETFLVAGLTLANANGTALKMEGGNWLTVTESRFLDNTSSTDAGAIDVANNFTTAPSWPTIRIERSEFSGNTNSGFSGGGAMRVGIRHDVHIEDSTFSDNRVTLPTSPAGALQLFLLQGGDATITRSTFEGNTAGTNGGGISMTGDGTSTLSVTHSTITSNTAGERGGGLRVATANVTLQNTIVAENSAPVDGPDIFFVAASVIVTGSNLVGNNRSITILYPSGQPNASGDYVGTQAVPFQAGLAALQDNGGWTNTREPVLAPALDKGDCPLESADQRGFVGTGGRAAGDQCDIGAMESGAIDPLLVFSSNFENGSIHRWQ